MTEPDEQNASDINVITEIDNDHDIDSKHDETTQDNDNPDIQNQIESPTPIILTNSENETKTQPIHIALGHVKILAQI